MNKIDRNPLNSDLLRSFLLIAETGNLTHAANRLGRTQSAVSVQLRNLEDSLGVALFDRSVKGMQLTNAGERLLPKAEAAVAQLQDMQVLFEKPLTGRLRIGIPDDYETHILAEALTRFSKRHPGVDVSALSGCTAPYPKAVRAGQLDMAVCSGPAAIGAHLVSIEDAVWAASKSARIRADAPLPLAFLDRACWWKTIPTIALQDMGRDFQITFRSESFGSLLSAVRAGIAVGVLPRSCVTDDMTILGAAENLPSLPKIYRFLLFSPNAPANLTQAMAEAIRATLPALWG